jgi:hypothetical protein
MSRKYVARNACDCTPCSRVLSICAVNGRFVQDALQLALKCEIIPATISS